MFWAIGAIGIFWLAIWVALQDQYSIEDPHDAQNNEDDDESDWGAEPLFEHSAMDVRMEREVRAVEEVGLLESFFN